MVRRGIQDKADSDSFSKFHKGDSLMESGLKALYEM